MVKDKVVFELSGVDKYDMLLPPGLQPFCVTFTTDKAVNTRATSVVNTKHTYTQKTHCDDTNIVLFVIQGEK